MKPIKPLAAPPLAAALAAPHAAQPAQPFEKRQLVHQGDTLPYRILYPAHYDRSQKYPLVLFLHGAGERGNDNQSQLKHGATLFTDPRNRVAHPAIILFPQCPADGFWAPMERVDGQRIYPRRPKPTPSMQMVERLIRQYLKDPTVDHTRIYVIGISMGGMGTYDYICRHPRLFACAVPICGAVNEQRLRRARHLPIRIYHGSADPVVPVTYSRDAYIALKANGSTNVEYIEYPGVQHESWDNAFAEPDFLDWIFSQRK